MFFTVSHFDKVPGRFTIAVLQGRMPQVVAGYGMHMQLSCETCLNDSYCGIIPRRSRPKYMNDDRVFQRYGREIMLHFIL